MGSLRKFLPDILMAALFLFLVTLKHQI